MTVVYVTGLSGVGKSYTLEHLKNRDIKVLIQIMGIQQSLEMVILKK